MSLLERLQAKQVEREVFYSFEYFPPSTERGRRNLQLRIDRMVDMQPLFVDVTSRSGSAEDTLELCQDILRFCGVDVMMHLTCVGMTKEDVVSLLTRAKQAGIRNVLALRGDLPQPQGGDAPFVPKEGELTRALDLVRIIRSEFGSYFTVAVAGYPEGLGLDQDADEETRTANRDEHIQILKQKVDAGADLCITQAFFDAEVFKSFVRASRAAGIRPSTPIIPGILPIHSFNSIMSLTKHLGVSLPEKVRTRLLELKGDRKAISEFGIALAGEMSLDLLNSGSAHGLHFYTFNLEHAVRQVLEEKLKVTQQSVLPWRPSADPKRLDEDVRPIFWANRPKSYLLRTERWEQFPSGRWGDLAGTDLLRSLQESDDVVVRDSLFDRSDIKRKAWGEALHTEADVFRVFADFIEGSVPFLPWCEESLHLETSTIKTKLEAINRAGMLTINSQPRVNAAPSDDPKFGWGPSDGYVYQKAYIEFFTSPKKLRFLIDLLQAPQFADRQLIFHATDAKGNTYSNARNMKPCAVTWGVFPGKEVIQPTVVDPDTFLIWKDEAFSLWIRGWAAIYDEDSPSADLLHDMHDEYFLVNIVDNDFVNGNIFDLFDKLVEAAPQRLPRVIGWQGVTPPRLPAASLAARLRRTKWIEWNLSMQAPDERFLSQRSRKSGRRAVVAADARAGQARRESYDSTDHFGVIPSGYGQHADRKPSKRKEQYQHHHDPRSEEDLQQLHHYSNSNYYHHGDRQEEYHDYAAAGGQYAVSLGANEHEERKEDNEMDVRDHFGNSVLSIACQNGLKRIAKLALRRGADINAVNHRGNTPLHFCYMYQYGETLGAYLISKGADPMVRNVEGQLCHETQPAGETSFYV
ncbi:Methylenetetrahydrofolate reductase [Durusdinium trenchii]|uniref:Methylenetetrahydrofolate reductase n=1 Tax=Durusdinium trenchii TaxID=1381693 RepID=A0ABP0RT12_9DINO